MSRQKVGLTALLTFGLLGMVSASLAAEDSPNSPWWWDDAWWEHGQLASPTNHSVEVRWDSYENGETEVPVMIARPEGDRQYPAVLYQHGRRGLDELIQKQVIRLAARGLVVAAPDVFSARFIEKFPIEHDYAVEGDLNRGVDFLLSLPDISTTKACLASHTRGGYMTLKVAVTHKRQEKDIACYVSWYPHMQDPNAPEPMQVYRYAPEADELIIPTLILIGEEEQYQRRRSIETAVKSMSEAGRPVHLIVYPGVGRGFDFRPPNVRTFADDLASKDAIARAAAFINKHLSPYAR